MAIGRRWIDANLIDMPGYRAYANDIWQAYNEDHPDEPFTFTNVSSKNNYIYIYIFFFSNL